MAEARAAVAESKLEVADSKMAVLEVRLQEAEQVRAELEAVQQVAQRLEADLAQRAGELQAARQKVEATEVARDR